jgi:mono/diheme cytochrome c family protein
MNGFALVVSLVLLGFGSILQEAAAPTAAPQAAPAAGKGIPIKITAEGTAHAKKMWGYDCAVCHGANGDGKGDIASSLKSKPKDYTDPASLSGMTDQELFTIIQKGKDEMPPEGDRAKPDDIWNMVALVRSFAKK